jgi:hypothetical protein
VHASRFRFIVLLDLDKCTFTSKVHLPTLQAIAHIYGYVVDISKETKNKNKNKKNPWG